MDLDLVFLGTGGSVPTARRSTACLLVRRGGDRILIDCGEGSQRQMVRSTGLVEVDEIYLTHLHADHFLGIPGLLKTYDLNSREKPLRIFGPRGLIDLKGLIERLVGRTSYPTEWTELDVGEEVSHVGYAMRSFAVEHRGRAQGYALVEEPRFGAFNPERARALGVAEGPDFGRLQRGETVPGSDGPVAAEEVVGAERPGRRIVVTGDTVPCDATLAAAFEADLLVHDASFSEEEADRAMKTGHSTATGAARLAAEAEAKLLALVHVSSRYNVGQVCEEARSIFEQTVAPRDFDVVEIPFPERGSPVHLRDGARSPQPVTSGGG